MLLIPKPGTHPLLLQTVINLCEQNKNTHKSTSPLPDMEGMLRCVAKQWYRMALDLKNGYEQVHIMPEHVPRSTVTTLDGNMISQVIQMGDCNTPVTYQALMNHLFSAYIGRFMDVYLDDIVIYSDTLEEHVEHVKAALDILRREKLYLSSSKLWFIVPCLKLLGRIVDDEGIQMDSAKVDSVINWKVPMNRDLLWGFIGSVGYLADDIPNIQIPMGVLSSLTGDMVPFCWGYAEQQAFDEVKDLVHWVHDHCRVPLNYDERAPPIWMVIDGFSGLVSQGDNWKMAHIVALFSAKLSATQENYAVHKIEMLAGVETMLRHVNILQGAKFKWLTDHKGLIYLLNQKNLTGWQACWLEKISSFSFEVVYIAGSENMVADVLLQMYLNDSPGMVHAQSEYTYHNIENDNTSELISGLSNFPVLAGIEACVATRHSTHVQQAPRPADADWEEPVVVDHFVQLHDQLHGEQKEGRSTDDALEATNRVSKGQDNGGVGKEPDNAQGISISDGHILDMEGGPNQVTPTTTWVPGSSLVDVLAQNIIGLDLLNVLWGKYSLDPAFHAILQWPNNFWNFEVFNQLVYLKELDKKILCIPKIIIQGRSAWEIVISEAHSLLAHLGTNKTLD